MSEPDGPASFTLVDAFQDAFANLRATWALHFAFCAVFIVMLGGSCCGVCCLLTPVFALFGIAVPDGAPDTDPPTMLMVVVYAVFLVAYVALFALHEGVTLEVTHAQVRGETPALRTAIDKVLRRAPAILGGVLLRLAIDFAPAALVVSLGAAVLAGVTPSTDAESMRTSTAVAITVAYFAFLAWALFTRAHFGLALSCLIRDGLGPLAAFERSLVLSKGRRWHFLAFRLAYFVVVFIAYVLALSPFVALTVLRPGWFDHQTNAAANAIVYPVLAALGALALALYALDTILVATYHARLARPLDASDVAKVFA
jgi:hypothetical protein